MKRLLFTLLFLVAATPTSAQVPGPRVNLAFNPPSNAPDCSGASTDPWGWTYQSACYLPTGVTLGSPFITQVRVTFTGATTSSVLVPRAQVVRETTTARCPGGSTPCLRINDVPAPAGASTITIAFVTGEGVTGSASTGVPFTGNPPAAPALSGARAVPE